MGVAAGKGDGGNMAEGGGAENQHNAHGDPPPEKTSKERRKLKKTQQSISAVCTPGERVKHNHSGCVTVTQSHHNTQEADCQRSQCTSCGTSCILADINTQTVSSHCENFTSDRKANSFPLIPLIMLS